MTTDRRAFLATAALTALATPSTLLADESRVGSTPRSSRDRRGQRMGGGQTGPGGLSRARLAQMHERLAAHVESGYLPGLVTLMSRRGETFVDTIGHLAFDRQAPMRRDTIFRIASLTKPVTAVAAMILVEEEKLNLDDPVDPWLPELADRRVQIGRAHV